MNSNTAVTVLKALADPTRLRLVRQLAQCETGLKSCGELSAKCNLSQPAMSHHFVKLVSAGVVVEQKLGTHKQYALNNRLLDKLGIDVKKL